MDINLIIQYTLVGLCLVGIVIWIVRKLVKLRKSGASGASACGCCSLGASCKKAPVMAQKADSTAMPCSDKIAP